MYFTVITLLHSTISSTIRLYLLLCRPILFIDISSYPISSALLQSYPVLFSYSITLSISYSILYPLILSYPIISYSIQSPIISYHTISHNHIPPHLLSYLSHLLSLIISSYHSTSHRMLCWGRRPSAALHRTRVCAGTSPVYACEFNVCVLYVCIDLNITVNDLN